MQVTTTLPYITRLFNYISIYKQEVNKLPAPEPMQQNNGGGGTNSSTQKTAFTRQAKHNDKQMRQSSGAVKKG